MIRLALIIFLILFSFESSSSTINKYPVSDIPIELLTNSNAVYRLDKTEFVIEKIDGALFRVHQVVTILNPKAANEGVKAISYDKLRKVLSFNATVYDKNGEVIYKSKSKDVIDQSNISGASLYEDNRIKGLDLRQKEYPYTIEVMFEVEFLYLFHIPDWISVKGESIGVQKSEYTISAPEHLLPNFLEVNMAKNSYRKTKSQNLTSYHWELKNIKPISIEPYSNGFESKIPIVYFSPSKFNYEGYEGDMSTWSGIAKWQTQLNAGRDAISTKTKEEVNLLVNGTNSTEEKIKLVYEYMQSRTRYVSIQLGIGGYQTFPASTVDEMGYGDCKALTNYMKSLLNSIGIDSHLALVNAGEEAAILNEEFPSMTFNHVILAVPMENDTTWLECTSQSNPFGYLGKFTGNRKVLLINDNIGKIVETPNYGSEENKIISNFQIDLDIQGNANAIIKKEFIGLASDYNGLSTFLTFNDKNQKEWLIRNIDISDFQINNYQFTQNKDKIPSINLESEITIRNIASKTGNRMFIPLNFAKFEVESISNTQNRETPIQFRYSHHYVDSVAFKIPKGYSVEYMPDAAEIIQPFGEFKMNITVKDNVIYYKRDFLIKEGVYSPESHEAINKFFNEVTTNDNKKVLLIADK